MAKVKVYSTNMCPWCRKAKEYLDGKKVEYEEVDVSADHDAAKEMIQKSGQRGVPVLDIDGQVIIGFDQQAIDKALNI